MSLLNWHPSSANLKCILEQHLSLGKQGQRKINVPGDGNCGFYAFSTVFWGNMQRGPKLRQLMVSFLQSNMKVATKCEQWMATAPYEVINSKGINVRVIATDPTTHLQNWCHEMKKSGTYIDELAIVLLVSMFNLELYLKVVQQSRCVVYRIIPIVPPGLTLHYSADEAPRTVFLNLERQPNDVSSHYSVATEDLKIEFNSVHSESHGNETSLVPNSGNELSPTSSNSPTSTPNDLIESASTPCPNPTSASPSDSSTAPDKPLTFSAMDPVGLTMYPSTSAIAQIRSQQNSGVPIVADGNCQLRALCLLLYGDQERHFELRQSMSWLVAENLTDPVFVSFWSAKDIPEYSLNVHCTYPQMIFRRICGALGVINLSSFEGDVFGDEIEDENVLKISKWNNMFLQDGTYGDSFSLYLLASFLNLNIHVKVNQDVHVFSPEYPSSWIVPLESPRNVFLEFHFGTSEYSNHYTAANDNYLEPVICNFNPKQSNHTFRYDDAANFLSLDSPGISSVSTYSSVFSLRAKIEHDKVYDYFHSGDMNFYVLANCFRIGKGVTRPFGLKPKDCSPRSHSNWKKDWNFETDYKSSLLLYELCRCDKDANGCDDSCSYWVKLVVTKRDLNAVEIWEKGSHSSGFKTRDSMTRRLPGKIDSLVRHLTRTWKDSHVKPSSIVKNLQLGKGIFKEKVTVHNATKLAPLIPTKTQIRNILKNIDRTSTTNTDFARTLDILTDPKWRNYILYPSPAEAAAMKPDEFIIVLTAPELIQFAKEAKSGVMGLDAIFKLNSEKFPLYSLLLSIDNGPGIPAFSMIAAKNSVKNISLFLNVVKQKMTELLGGISWDPKIMIDHDEKEMKAARENDFDFILCQFHIVELISKHMKLIPDSSTSEIAEIWEEIYKIQRSTDLTKLDNAIRRFLEKYNEQRYKKFVEAMTQSFFVHPWNSAFCDIKRRGQKGLFNTNNYTESWFKILRTVYLENRRVSVSHLLLLFLTEVLPCVLVTIAQYFESPKPRKSQEQSAKEARALALVENNKLAAISFPSLWKCEKWNNGESTKQFYLISLGDDLVSCTCKSHFIYGGRCKHILAAEFELSRRTSAANKLVLDCSEESEASCSEIQQMDDLDSSLANSQRELSNPPTPLSQEDSSLEASDECSEIPSNPHRNMDWTPPKKRVKSKKHKFLGTYTDSEESDVGSTNTGGRPPRQKARKFKTKKTKAPKAAKASKAIEAPSLLPNLAPIVHTQPLLVQEAPIETPVSKRRSVFAQFQQSIGNAQHNPDKPRSKRSRGIPSHYFE